MKYGDLVDVPTPLERVKQVRDSASEDAAASDVETFVISDRMAEQLRDTVVPQLRFDTGGDHSGLLIVGTYGTGKTHLMSMIAGVCEFPDVLGNLRREDMQETFAPVSGRFKVIRFDIGANAMSLRDIVCTELTRGLAKIGVEFAFPPIDQVTNTKDDLIDMMAAVEAAYPDDGLLFVLDEMLDYLRMRKDAELIQDLAFLREIGEVCKNTRFRFIGGLQETLFDNPRFAGVADAIRRVRDRFEQVRIAREDVAFVVTERLLPKSSSQKEQIREHLTPFTPMFDGMAERLDDFVDLFPIHPAFLSTFEQLTLIEKREILRTIEGEIRRLEDEDIPADAPGLVCIDSYRERLADDPSVRTVPEVKDVLDKSAVVRAKIATALPEKHYIDTATRIVDALAVHRLTTDDVHARIGLTVDELRDQLCLLPPGLPKQDAMFLRTTIEAIVKKTMQAVSGQFLSRNDDNGQIYLDIDKDIDYDQLIDQRAESLDDDRLDAAYYLALEQTLGISDNPYVSGYKIWAYSLAWPEKRSERSGYLFMGAPNERSTAQPPRDFYLYFLQPYDLPKFVDEEKPDEVFLRLSKPDEAFTHALRRYAGALELAKESTADRRSIYESKATTALQDMVAWLRSNLATAMTVTYKGEARTIGEWLQATEGDRSSVTNQLRSIATYLLTDYFEARYPGYPTFGVEITPENLGDAVRTALTTLADPSHSTTHGRKILASLELLDPDGAVTADGQFATALVDELAAANGKVLNRSQLLTERDKGLRSWAPWHLEPVWLVVTAAALVHLGKAELSYADGKIDALSLNRLATLPVDDLVEFTNIAPPAALPTDRLAEAAALLGILPGAVPTTGATEGLVTEVGTRAVTLLKEIVEAERILDEGLELWGQPLIDLVDERRARINALRSLAEDMKARNSIGKLNKLSTDETAIEAAREGRAELTWISQLQQSRGRMEPTAAYLREAVTCFGEQVDASKDALELREEMLTALGTTPIEPETVVALAGRGETLRKTFAKLAADYYRHTFLDASGDKRKQQLLEGEIWAALERLATIELLPGGLVTNLRSDLADVRTLLDVSDDQLTRSVKLGDHIPGPVAGLSAAARLENLETRVQEVFNNWQDTLVDNVSDPDLDAQLELLSTVDRAIVAALRDERVLPLPLGADFAPAINAVFDPFKVHRVTGDELLHHLFPGESAATPSELQLRLDGYLKGLARGGTLNKVRVVLTDDPQLRGA